MKTLEKKEWVAVVVSIFVVGFFFLFGPGLLSIFTGNTDSTTLLNSGPQLEIQDVKVGGGKLAISGSRVTVHYTGRFVDGKIFASSVVQGEPVQFILGTGQVIEGWDKGILNMREGGKRFISVPPELGYGFIDYGPIPAGSTLIFEIDLLKVE
ncbi:MAG: FKBP-type peptidyl-prolyl cis-trans isomerase [Candidatus Paceibacterota bacterium]